MERSHCDGVAIREWRRDDGTRVWRHQRGCAAWLQHHPETRTAWGHPPSVESAVPILAFQRPCGTPLSSRALTPVFKHVPASVGRPRATRTLRAFTAKVGRPFRPLDLGPWLA